MFPASSIVNFIILLYQICLFSFRLVFMSLRTQTTDKFSLSYHSKFITVKIVNFCPVNKATVSLSTEKMLATILITGRYVFINFKKIVNNSIHLD